MRLASKTALGIDISDGLINLTLIKKDKDGFTLLKADTAAVPEGVIKNGNIEDAAKLARAIKRLKAKNRMHNCPTAISLVANPALMQILDLPTTMPANIRQFVRDEVKHYAVLPIKNTAIDYCGLNSSSNAEHRRTLIVATDGQKVTNVARAFRKEGLNIEAVEPTWIAYSRACYEKKIATKFDTNLLFVTLHNSIVTLGVFRNQTLEFVRVKKLIENNCQSEKCLNWLIEEINAIIQFYDFSQHGKSGKWEVTLLTNISDEFLANKIESLKNSLSPSALEVRTLEDAYLDTPIANEEHDNKPSAVAVGLAMKMLDAHGTGLNINLFPTEVNHAKSQERSILISANVAAVIFLMMILSIGFFNTKVNKVDAGIRQKTPPQLSMNIRSLLDEQTLLQKQTKNISGKLNCLNNALNKDCFLNWGQILDEIKLVIPKNVRVVNFSTKNNSQMLIEGKAASYENVNCFIDTLNSCEHIQSASIITTGKENSSDSLLSYVISCSLVQQKGGTNER